MQVENSNNERIIFSANADTTNPDFDLSDEDASHQNSDSICLIWGKSCAAANPYMYPFLNATQSAFYDDRTKVIFKDLWQKQQKLSIEVVSWATLF